MEERYEIRGKIGQGGIGSVYRGYDTRMNREVAIKRISTSVGDPALQEESTRQLIKEAGALASLQHPHIVTIYDVGSDEDGPYVVMELISGKTLDELIENAPLTWPDFRELAMQTQEALIAAQELDLIHSDLKPSNLMLTWLPSGKFQIKIVDFGLATLTHSQSKEELETLEAVFGSIFFMAPEQFERIPLDARSDLYSMGCVYYQALTGVYPFNGETGTEVMAAHLHHIVKPIQEMRSDIPMWACDWIMWQINRLPQDRPESARDSLSVFLQNDKNPDPTMSLGPADAANAVKRPRLIIPGSEPAPATASVPIQTTAPAPLVMAVNQGRPTEAATPAKSTTAMIAPAAKAALVTDPVDLSAPHKTKTAPQPLTPPEGSKPSVHTAPQAIPEPEPKAAVVSVTKPITFAPAGPVLPAGPAVPAAKRKLSNAAKTMIAAVLALLVVLLGWILINRSGQNHKTALYNQMISAAAKDDAVEVPVDQIKLELLLEAAANTGIVEQRATIYKALYLAKATDGSDVDARIAEFATTRELLPDLRRILIRDVLRMRKNPAIVPTLITFARSTKDKSAAIAALEAIRFMAGDEQFESLLGVVMTSSQPDIRSAAEGTLSEVIKKTKDRPGLSAKIANSYENSVDKDARQALLRLLGRCGTPKALELVKKALDSNEATDKIAAIVALGAWSDDAGFHLLIDFLTTTSQADLRAKAFEEALRYASQPTVVENSAGAKELWTELSKEATLRNEKTDLIRRLTNFNDDWAMHLIEAFKESEDETVSDYANRAIQAVKARKGGKDSEQ